MGSLCLIAAAVSPFFVEFTPEVRTTYQSLGKLVEDRPMQVTSLKFGWDSGSFGRIGVRNWDVSSLTDRRSDVHRHALYHTEFGPIWGYDWEFAGGWKLKSELTRSWVLYRGFEKSDGNKTYHYWQIEQSLENPYVVPFYRFRRSIRTSDYLYFKLGLRRKFPVWSELSVTPSVFVEGGNARNQKRVFGERPGGKDWSDGVSSISFRLGAAWRFNANFSVFAAVEQYWVLGEAERDANAASSYCAAHNEWFHAAFGVRLKF